MCCHDVCFLYSHVEPKKRRPIKDQEYEETPQEKKLRLAKLYIDQLKEQGKFVLYIKNIKRCSRSTWVFIV